MRRYFSYTRKTDCFVFASVGQSLLSKPREEPLELYVVGRDAPSK